MEEVKKIKNQSQKNKTQSKTKSNKTNIKSSQSKIKTNQTKAKTNQTKNQSKKSKTNNTVSKKVTITNAEEIATKVEPKNKKTVVEEKKKKNTINKKLEGPDLKQLEIEVRKDIDSKHHEHNTKKLVLLIIILILLIISFICLQVVTPKVYINGDNEIDIPYGGTYKEKGAKAKYFNIDLTKSITVTDNINVDKVGKYHVVYTIKHAVYEIKRKRIVNVVDRIKPMITLEGEKEVEVCPNKEFKEIGYKALDEYDGDLTDKVKVNKKNNEIIYSVSDSSGNEFSITRKINKVDNIKPVISLKGNSTMYLTPDEDFTEPGYTASDNCSGDLTSKVLVTGSVSSRQKGTYTLTYTVTDDSSNKITVERKVTISDKTNPNSGEIKKGTIYLTFDDGPSSVTTGAILDALKEEGVKATFFVTNSGPDYLIQRIYNEGHTIALHTASHNYATVYSSVDNYFKDLDIVSNRVKRLTGQTSKIVRFPGGSSNTISRKYSSGIMTKLSQELFGRGYRYYDWNVDSRDASTSKTKEAVYNSVTKNLSKDRANVVLMHDIKVPTRDAIRSIIKYGKQNGYTFDRIDMSTYMVRQHINN